MSATSVKFLHSQMTGAPVLTGQAGAMIAVLDAVLKDGWGLNTVDSIVIASGVATVTRAAGHPFEPASVALIAGATVTGGDINGERRVIATTATTYTFDATGITDQTATGAPTHKVAPLGWVKPYSGTNLAAYKSGDAGSTLCLLRVDDTGTTNARVVGYESMSDINTGTGPFPTAAQQSGGGYWGKSSTADATARAWQVVGDERTFYLLVQYNAATNITTQVFGDLVSRKAADAFACTLSAPAASIVGTTNSTSDVAYCGATAQWIARGYGGVGSSVAISSRAVVSPVPAITNNFSGQSAGTFMAYPDAAANALIACPITITESGGSNIALRGTLPGMYFLPQNVYTASVFAQRDSVVGVTGLTGRTLRAFVNGSGAMLADVTGPWR